MSLFVLSFPVTMLYYLIDSHVLASIHRGLYVCISPARAGANLFFTHKFLIMALYSAGFKAREGGGIGMGC